MSSDGQARISVGSEVTLHGRPQWRGVVVDGPLMVQRTRQCQVQWSSGGTGKRWVPVEQLEVLRPDAVRCAGADDFRADLAVAKFQREFIDVLFSIGASRTEFLVYQYKPVLQFVRQMSHGLLIADEVGLGKTIEAALILRELLARGAVHRVLVVCPANLREKWREELRQRFSIDLRDLRSQEVLALHREFEERGVWPTFFGVSSLEGLRRKQIQKTLQETAINFDLVIVDEAHHLRNQNTRSFDLGEILSDQADHILLLSATPIQTDQSDLLSLLKLVEPSQFEVETLDDLDARLEPNAHINAALSELAARSPNLDKVAAAMSDALDTPYGAGFRSDDLYLSWLRQLEDRSSLAAEEVVRLRRDLQERHTLAPFYTRTRKRDVEASATRRARTIEVPLTDVERDFYDAWIQFLIALHRSKGSDTHPGFWIVQRERQAASSLRAAKVRLSELLQEEGLDNEFAGVDLDQLPNDRPTNRPANAAATDLDAAVRNARQAAARLTGDDSKLERLTRLLHDLLLERPRRKVLVFTSFLTTLSYLEQELPKRGFSTKSISGRVKPGARSTVVRDFIADRDCNVLLSTEVGSEGLDFQFCDVVINYDLPWNPMRVEQRIGRIDRFGQRAEEVVVASFFAEETIDTRILSRLYKRINVFTESIGAIEPILGKVIRDLQSDAFRSGFSEAEIAQRTHDAELRIENLRQEFEDFENQRAALLGHGELLLNDITDMRRSGRYVSPAEVRALLRRWLAREDPGGRGIVSAGKRAEEVIYVGGAALNRAHDWMNQQRISATTDDFMNIARRDGSVQVAFTGAAARDGVDLPFIHSGHPLVQYAADLLQRDVPSEWVARVGSFAKPQTLPQLKEVGRVALAIFSLELIELESRRSMMPIVIDLESFEEYPAVADLLLGSIPDAEDAPLASDIDHEMLELIQIAAMDAAESRRKREERAARDQQTARRAVQRAQLQRSFGARIRRRSDIGKRVDDARIRRLYEGEVRNLESELERRLAELDAAPEPIAQIELLAVGIFS